MMTVDLRRPWTQERFFNWAQAQDDRYEFNGSLPVAMTGEDLGHAVVSRNLRTSLHAKLRGTECRSFGADAGVETVNKAVRYPDALITCSEVEYASHLVAGAVAVFEVVGFSPRSIHTDRVTKVREYAAVPSIRRYVLVESSFIGLTVLERDHADHPWILSVLSDGDILHIPEVGVEIPIAEIYEDLEFYHQENGPV